MTSNDGWHHPSDLKTWGESGDGIVHTFGFLLEKTKEYFLVSPSVAEKNDFSCEQYNFLLKIPRGCVKKYKVYYNLI